MRMALGLGTDSEAENRQNRSESSPCDSHRRMVVNRLGSTSSHRLWGSLSRTTYRRREEPVSKKK